MSTLGEADRQVKPMFSPFRPVHWCCLMSLLGYRKSIVNAPSGFGRPGPSHQLPAEGNSLTQGCKV